MARVGGWGGGTMSAPLASVFVHKYQSYHWYCYSRMTVDWYVAYLTFCPSAKTIGVAGS